MKRILCAALAVAAFLVPTTPQELGRLKPVEVIKVDVQGSQIRIETDTDDAGQGKTVEQALTDLRAGASGTIYLDTAQYLLVPEGRKDLIIRMAPYLKNAVQLCCWEGEILMEEVGQYLDCHSPELALKEYKPGMNLRTLTAENERVRLVEKDRKNLKKVLDKECGLC